MYLGEAMEIKTDKKWIDKCETLYNSIQKTEKELRCEAFNELIFSLLNLNIPDGIDEAIIDGYKFSVSKGDFGYYLVIYGKCPTCGKDVYPVEVTKLEDIARVMFEFIPVGHTCKGTLNE
jgi:hypothetical protein